MNINYLFLLAGFTLAGLSASGQKSKKCYKLSDSKQYAQAAACFRSCSDSTSAEALYGLADAYLAQRNQPELLDSAYRSSMQAARAYSSLNDKNRQKLQASHGLSPSVFVKQQNKASFYAYKYINDTVLTELTNFMSRYRGTPESKIAQEKMEEFVTLLNLPEGKPVEFYRRLIERYPTNPNIGKAWELFYRTYTFDGELLTLEKFVINYPAYPFPEEIKRDRNAAQLVERYKLDSEHTPSISNIYRSYILQAAPRHLSLKVLRMYIRPMIEARDFARAADTVQSFAAQFGDSPSYAGLLQVLTEETPVTSKKPLAGFVNSTGTEFSPVLTENDRVMYFCGKNRTGNIGGEDIFVSRLTDSLWSEPSVIPGINTVLGNEAPESLSADGTQMLLFQNGDIYSSNKYLNHLKQMRWSDPVRFPTVNTSGWDGDATLSSDGNALLFATESGQRHNMQYIARDRKDRFDIYVSVHGDKGWSEPINLGENINTHFCERYPYLHPDMQTLYFSSEGHGGLGGLDVFVSKRLNPDSWTEWSVPKNLGRYINTAQDDTGYKISNDGTLAYFAVFEGAQSDIYTVELPEHLRPQKLAVISGRVLSADSAGISAQIRAEDLTTGELIGQWRSNVEDGSFTVLLPLGRSYGYFVSQEGYFPTSAHIDLMQTDTMIELQQMFVMQSIDTLIRYSRAVEMPNIFFATDEHKLHASSYPELRRIAKILSQTKITEIQIEGHTDSVGTAQYNMRLSQKRAQSVADFLKEQNGLANMKIIARGYGSTYPTSFSTEVGELAKNRRVELRFGKNGRE